MFVLLRAFFCFLIKFYNELFLFIIFLINFIYEYTWDVTQTETGNNVLKCSLGVSKLIKIYYIKLCFMT